jgi:hypothetical protein
MKIKDIKPYEWAIGIGVGIIGYFVIRNLSKLGGSEINGIHLSTEDKKSVADTNSEKMIQQLHPKFKNLARAFVNRVKNKLGYTVFLTSGYRSFDKQQQLYNENHQNAKPGYSSHNYGFAIDVNVKDKNGNLMLTKSTSDQKWNDSGVLKIAKDLGLKWGGGGTFGSYNDRVHFFINPNGKSTQQLLAEYNKGNVDSQGYVNV